MVVEPIGFVRSARLEVGHTPVQAALNLAESGVAEVDARFVDALEGLAGFSHVWLVTWLGRDAEPGLALRQVPFLLQPDGPEVGVFATRGPRRPNPIGLSLVELVEVDGRSLRFRGVDVVDATPLLDVKPYVGRFDRPLHEPRCGWFDGVELPEAATPASLSGRARRLP